MGDFRWTPKRERAALALAEGYTEEESAAIAGVSRPTISRWKRNLDFSTEVDRLSLMVGIASRAERLRIAMQIVRQKVKADGRYRTARDLLDWLKFAQSETDGAKFDLATIFEAMETAASDGETTTGDSESGQGND